MMNNGSPAVSAGLTSDNLRVTLNTVIFDYLLKHGHYEVARSIVRDDKFEMKSEQKSSPGRRKDGEINGDAGDGMDMNMKDDVPDDLPRPSGWDGTQTSGFLLEWFGIFHDLLQAHRMTSGTKMNGNMAMTPASTYLLHEKVSRIAPHQSRGVLTSEANATHARECAEPEHEPARNESGHDSTDAEWCYEWEYETTDVCRRRAGLAGLFH